MSIELDPNTHKFMRKISDQLSKNSDLLMAPMDGIPFHEKVSTPSFAIAAAIQDVANVIRQELAE